MAVPQDCFLPLRLAATEKLCEDLFAKMERLERYLKAAIIQHGAAGRLHLSQDVFVGVEGKVIIESCIDLEGERTVRLELMRGNHERVDRAD